MLKWDHTWPYNLLQEVEMHLFCSYSCIVCRRDALLHLANRRQAGKHLSFKISADVVTDANTKVFPSMHKAELHSFSFFHIFSSFLIFSHLLSFWVALLK